MRRFIILAGVGIALILLVLAVSRYYIKKEKKSHSPEDRIEFNRGDLSITLFYNRPYKKEQGNIRRPGSLRRNLAHGRE